MNAQEIKNEIKKGKEIIFDNEMTFTDNFISMECNFKIDKKNNWANGFNIQFNGKLFSFKTFDAFFKKFSQLKKDFNLDLKTF